jgi:hypothetical protein
MRTLLREPLLHFVLLGAAIFVVYAWLSPERGPGEDEIVVSAGQVEHLAITFSRVWQRPPTREELKGLIDDYVVEEALCREALKLGLDENDTVIRRRLRQKMEFITEDFATSAEPTDADLQAFLDEHPDQFRVDPRYTFTHVFLSEDRADIHADAAQMIERLSSLGPGADTSELGDRLLVPREFTGETRRNLASQFGQDFAARLDEVPIGGWSGPVPSAYGIHFILMTERIDGRLPPLDEIREQLKRELRVVRREKSYAEFLDGVLSQYEVTIEWPGGVDGAGIERTSGMP